VLTPLKLKLKHYSCSLTNEISNEVKGVGPYLDKDLQIIAAGLVISEEEEGNDPVGTRRTQVTELFYCHDISAATKVGLLVLKRAS